MLYNALIGAEGAPVRLTKCRYARTSNLDTQTIPPPPNESNSRKGTRSVAAPPAARRSFGISNGRDPFWRPRRLGPLRASEE